MKRRAGQTRLEVKPDILFLSHCAPTLPDKGERIRAFHEVQYLAKRYRVHVAAFTQESRLLETTGPVKAICGSLHIELLKWKDRPGQGLQFLLGNSLTGSFYHHRSLRHYVQQLCREVNRLSATVAFSSVMAPYAPAGVPLLLDMVDVDSEKWADYARVRRPRWFFRMEARRMQEQERHYSGIAKSVILTTEQESALLRQIAPNCRVRAVENGVDFSYFDPFSACTLPELNGRRYIVMVGAMNYFPQLQMARSGSPRMSLRVYGQRYLDLEFFIVGHRPPAAVQRLGNLPGITVTGYVPDVRPYVAQALTAVVPLRIARGVQNKVLEALAMGKTVLASPEIARTFGKSLPEGLRICPTADEYHRYILEALSRGSAFDPSIRESARERFSWDHVFVGLDEELKLVLQSGVHSKGACKVP